MTFLDVIRFSFSGTTKALSQPVKGRLNFNTSLFFVFGIIQLLLLFGFFLVYFQFSEETTHSIETFYEDEHFYRFVYYNSYVSQVFVLFIVLGLWRQGGSQAKVLSFKKAMGSFGFKPFLGFALTIIFILASCSYLSVESENGFGEIVQNENPFWFRESHLSWYVHLLKKTLLIIVRFAPSIFVGYYLVSCKMGDWKMRYIVDFWKPVLALVILWTGASLLFSNGWVILSDSILAMLAIPFEEVYIPSFLNLLLFLFLSIHYYKIVAYLAYFSVFEWGEEHQPVPNELFEKTDLLDQ